MEQIWWMLSLIPDSIMLWLFYLLFFSGVALIVASWLVKWIPVITNYKFPVQLLGIILYGGGAWLLGGYGVEQAWRARVAELEEKVKVAEAKSQEVKVEIQEKIVYKTKVVEKTKVEIKERIVKEREVIDAMCVIPPEAISIHNQAANGAISETKK